MPTTIYDVCGIGSAIVDVLASVEDAFITEHKLARGAMTLIDEDRAHALYALMDSATECSGGSVANTLAGIASLGGMPSFIGKVRQDVLGEIFRNDMHAAGVHFDTNPSIDGKATARCYIFVTPDAQRTMNTYLGACSELTENDINDAIIGHSQVTYVEGYLWDLPHVKDAIRKAIAIAKKYGRKVAFSLSDGFCVDRHRDEFMELVEHHIDILFANENEAMSLMQMRSFESTRDALNGKCPIVALTRSEKGSLILTGKEIIPIAPQTGLNVIDTTGAGDLYASGFLYGITQGWDLKRAGDLGSRCASHIIQQMGARALTPLNTLI